MWRRLPSVKVCVDQRPVLEVLEGPALHRVDGEETGADPAAEFGDEGVVVLEPDADRRGVAVEEPVGPEDGAPDVALGQPGDDASEHPRVLHPPGDAVEVDRVEGMAVEPGDDLLVGAVLRDRLPRLLVGGAGRSTTVKVTGGTKATRSFPWETWTG